MLILSSLAAGVSYLESTAVGGSIDMILNGLEERKRSSSEGRPYSIQVTRSAVESRSAATAAIIPKNRELGSPFRQLRVLTVVR